MFNKVLIFSVLAIFTVASGRVVRDVATNEGTHAFDLTEIFKNIETAAKEFENTLLKTFQVENSQQLLDKGLEQTKKASELAHGWLTDLKGDVEKLPENDKVKAIRDKISEGIDEFSKNNPQTAEDIKKYTHDFNEFSNKLGSEIKELGESETVKNLNDKSQKFVDDLKSIMEKIIADSTKKTEH